MIRSIFCGLMLCIAAALVACDSVDVDVAPEPEYDIVIEPSEKAVDATINEFAVKVVANHTWRVHNDVEWITITPKDSLYNESKVLHFRVNENVSREPRTGSVDFYCDTKRISFTVTQEGFDPYIDISEEELLFGYREAEKQIRITSNCGWYARAESGWIAISPSTGLIGNFDMVVNVATNDKESTRESSITVWNDTYEISRQITITQNGAPEVNDKDYVDEYGINHGPGVVIRGLSWAAVNCGYHAEHYPYGKMYQWGRAAGLGYVGDEAASEPEPNIAEMWQGENGSEAKDTFYCSSGDSRYSYDWIKEGDNAFWNLGTDENPIKNCTYDPCPEGWRVPTAFEFRSLVEFTQYGWETSDGLYGCTFTDINGPEGNSLFLPAGGRLNISDGRGYDRTLNGYYWTSTTDVGSASYLYFYSDNCTINSQGSRAGGCLLRCVKE